MISPIFMESALRSVLFALTVWIGLRVFAVRNVLAQKVAWGLVLASALTMPVVLPMTEHWSVLPANVRVTIPADPSNLLEELQARLQAKKTPAQSESSAEPATTGDSSPAKSSGDIVPTEAGQKMNLHPAANVQARVKEVGVPNGVINRYPAPVRSHANSAEPQESATATYRRAISLVQLGGYLYLAVAGLLLTRLLYGLLVALRMWHSAKPAQLDASPLSDGLCLRVSESIASPVTIGSAVILPNDCHQWDSEKLRIVLAHERSHIRQGDFYLQLMAGVYAAAVWFSPLGWWLKHKLSDLAEAISDRAGLEEAADPASYARILLEFAAAPRPTILGVAMARHGSLSRRIERLLNDVSFRQAFANTRRGLAAVLLVPVALFAATTMVRVQAAGQQAPATPAAPTTPTTTVAPMAPDVPPAPREGVSKPDQISDELPEPAVAPQAPQKSVTPQSADNCPPQEIMAPPAPPRAPGVPAAPALIAPPAHVPGSADLAPVSPDRAPVMILRDRQGISTLAIPTISMRAPVMMLHRDMKVLGHPTLAILAPAPAAYGEGRGYGVGQSLTTESGSVIRSDNGNKSGYRYSYSTNGDSYAIVRGNSQMSFNGNIHTSDLEKARKQAGGKDFLWFERNGKAYVVDDPATLAQIEAMYKPMEELGHRQEELGKKQEAIGKQQEELGKQQEAASVPTPDMSKEIAGIEEGIAKLKASQGKNMTQDQFGELQEKIGELQSRLGEIQGQIGEKQGEFGEKMGALGEKMGTLGEQMGQLGEQMGKIGEQADQKVKSIIDQSLKNGKAHPVQ
jgi:beta-lactamase regulating signal transducer with metallopeptidase domain